MCVRNVCRPSLAPGPCRSSTTQRLVGAGSNVAKGTFVRVAEADAERVTLDGRQQFTHAKLLQHTRADALRPCVVAVNLRHLYVGASRATSSELLAVL